MSNEAASGLVGESGNTQPQPGMEAAIEALLPVICPNPRLYDEYRRTARRQVAAAYPLIADAVLAEAERRIMAEPWAAGDDDGMVNAAEVVADLRRGLGENQ